MFIPDVQVGSDEHIIWIIDMGVWLVLMMHKYLLLMKAEYGEDWNNLHMDYKGILILGNEDLCIRLVIIFWIWI